MGSISGCRASLDTAQLATRTYPLCAWSESPALLGERQRSDYLAQVLEQKRDKLRQGCTIPCPNHKLSVGQLQSNSLASRTDVCIRLLKTSSISNV
jgi:hypothetical protein